MPSNRKENQQKRSLILNSKTASSSDAGFGRSLSQKKTEDLECTAREWEQAFDAIPDIIALISPTFQFIRLNKAGYEALGKTPQQVIGKMCYQLVHGQEEPVDECPCVKMLKTKKPEAGEVMVGDRYYMATAAPVLSNKGELVAFAHTLKDITERKQAEDELRKYRDQLQELVEQRTYDLKTINKQLLDEIKGRKRTDEKIERSYQVQSVLSQLLNVSLQNIPMEEMLRQILERIVSIPWLAIQSKGTIFLVEEEPDVLVMKAQWGLTPALSTTCSRVPFGRCLCGRAASSGEIEFSDCLDQRHENHYEGISPHGHYCVPILSPDKKILGVINLYLKEGHQRDSKEEQFLLSVAYLMTGIIERKRSQEKLRVSEERYRTLVENASDFIFMLDEEGKVSSLNKAAAQLLGKGTEEVMGKSITELFPKEISDNYLKNINQVFRKGLSLRNESKLATGKKELWISDSLNPVRDSQGKVVAVLVVSRDITKRRKIEEELRQTTRELKIEREAMERKNITLREILSQIDAEKDGIKQQIAANLEQTIIPILLKLKEFSDPFPRRLFEMLERDLREISSPFLTSLKYTYSKLSPRELEICRLIKNGMTSKEIARVLSISPTTAYKYRQLIRKKLQLVKTETNLQSFLQIL
jgi:PAS domain S-box-containing protein